MTGLLSGALALIALDALVNTAQGGPGNFGAVLGFLQRGVAWLVDPSVPGVPNLAGDKGPATSAGAATSSFSQPASAVLIPSAVTGGAPPAVSGGPIVTPLPAPPAGAVWA